ncbi:class I SAM-dependent methyltransferase [Candidatus Micrarchaeota archaeon]|nr:class I SAM-dependent methyltransferase [Candidatus Micrarchaeota archaeon]
MKNRLSKLLYSMVWPVYDIFFGAGTPFVKNMRKRLIEKLELKKGQRVADIGIGTGANVPFIHEQIGPEGEIFGIDISREMLNKCRKNLDKWGIKADLMLGDAEELPYNDRSFDAILCFGIFNHVDNPDKLLKEIMRIATPGAKIVIGDEIFPFLARIPKLPENAVDVRKSRDSGILPFWIVEFKNRK